MNTDKEIKDYLKNINIRYSNLKFDIELIKKTDFTKEKEYASILKEDFKEDIRDLIIFLRSLRDILENGT
jgi:hypothetical protein